jgi:hypothetical protein
VAGARDTWDSQRLGLDCRPQPQMEVLARFPRLSRYPQPRHSISILRFLRGSSCSFRQERDSETWQRGILVPKWWFLLDCADTRVCAFFPIQDDFAGLLAPSGSDGKTFRPQMVVLVRLRRSSSLFIFPTHRRFRGVFGSERLSRRNFSSPNGGSC